MFNLYTVLSLQMLLCNHPSFYNINHAYNRISIKNKLLLIFGRNLYVEDMNFFSSFFLQLLSEGNTHSVNQDFFSGPQIGRIFWQSYSRFEMSMSAVVSDYVWFSLDILNLDSFNITQGFSIIYTRPRILMSEYG